MDKSGEMQQDKDASIFTKVIYWIWTAIWKSEDEQGEKKQEGLNRCFYWQETHAMQYDDGKNRSKSWKPKKQK